MVKITKLFLFFLISSSQSQANGTEIIRIKMVLEEITTQIKTLKKIITQAYDGSINCQNPKIIGDLKWYCSKKLEKFIISNRLRKNVFLIDWMDYQDFVELISLSHLFLHPSRFDAYGSVNLSISQGTATNASRNSGSAKELIKNNINGILYNPFDIRFLSEMIVKLYKSKITRNKFNNFSKIFSKKIDIEYILNNLLKNII